MATLSIVAYNGIQQRTRESTVKLNLQQVNKQLAATKAQADTYPNDQAAFNASISTGNIGYVYTSDGLTYCLSTVAGSKTFKSTQNGDVSEGLCVPVYVVGNTGPAGGVVFYDAGSQQSWGRYLEAAKVDLTGAYSSWTWCRETYGPAARGNLLGVTGTAIGLGKSQTQMIADNCTDPRGAADAVRSYSQGGATDWYLPSRDEALVLCQQKGLSGINLTQNGYITSTENNSAAYPGTELSNCQYNGYSKSTFGLLRPIRSF